MTMSLTHHDEPLADRAAMLAMRAMIASQPAADLGPSGRPAFDDLMERTPAADGVAYEPAMLGVSGWWCRPFGADAGGARERYLGRRDPRDPLASPLYGDLAGLPPPLLHVGEDEILLDDARRYAERLEAAGSPGELHVWKGMAHVFPDNLASLRAAREATDDIGAFLRLYLAGTPSGPRAPV